MTSRILNVSGVLAYLGATYLIWWRHLLPPRLEGFEPLIALPVLALYVVLMKSYGCSYEARERSNNPLERTRS